MTVNLPLLASTYQGSLVRATVPPGIATQILTADPRRWSIAFAPQSGLGASVSVAPLRITSTMGVGTGWQLAAAGLLIKFADHPGLVGADWWAWNAGASPATVEMWVSTYVG
jgi:hypothetical protein